MKCNDNPEQTKWEQSSVNAVDSTVIAEPCVPFYIFGVSGQYGAENSNGFLQETIFLFGPLIGCEFAVIWHDGCIQALSVVYYGGELEPCTSFTCCILIVFSGLRFHWLVSGPSSKQESCFSVASLCSNDSQPRKRAWWGERLFHSRQGAVIHHHEDNAAQRNSNKIQTGRQQPSDSGIKVFHLVNVIIWALVSVKKLPYSTLPLSGFQQDLLPLC